MIMSLSQAVVIAGQWRPPMDNRKPFRIMRQCLCWLENFWNNPSLTHSTPTNQTAPPIIHKVVRPMPACSAVVYAWFPMGIRLCIGMVTSESKVNHQITKGVKWLKKVLIHVKRGQKVLPRLILLKRRQDLIRKFRNWLLKLKGGSVSIIVLQPKRLMRKKIFF